MASMSERHRFFLNKDEAMDEVSIPNSPDAFRKARRLLRDRTSQRVVEELASDVFWDNGRHSCAPKCIFSNVISGKITQPGFQAAEQEALGAELGKRWMVAAFTRSTFTGAPTAESGEGRSQCPRGTVSS